MSFVNRRMVVGCELRVAGFQCRKYLLPNHFINLYEVCEFKYYGTYSTPAESEEPIELIQPIELNNLGNPNGIYQIHQ